MPETPSEREPLSLAEQGLYNDLESSNFKISKQRYFEHKLLIDTLCEKGYLKVSMLNDPRMQSDYRFTKIE